MSQDLNDGSVRDYRNKNLVLQIARVPDWISHNLPEDWRCDLMEYGDRCLADGQSKWLVVIKIWFCLLDMGRAAIVINPGKFAKGLFASSKQQRSDFSKSLRYSVVGVMLGAASLSIYHIVNTVDPNNYLTSSAKISPLISGFLTLNLLYQCWRTLYLGFRYITCSGNVE